MAREIEWAGTAFTDTMLTVSAGCVNEEQRVSRMLSLSPLWTTAAQHWLWVY